MTSDDLARWADDGGPEPVDPGDHAPTADELVAMILPDPQLEANTLDAAAQAIVTATVLRHVSPYPARVNTYLER